MPESHLHLSPRGSFASIELAACTSYSTPTEWPAHSATRAGSAPADGEHVHPPHVFDHQVVHDALPIRAERQREQPTLGVVLVQGLARQRAYFQRCPRLRIPGQCLGGQRVDLLWCGLVGDDFVQRLQPDPPPCLRQRLVGGAAWPFSSSSARRGGSSTSQRWIRRSLARSPDSTSIQYPACSTIRSLACTLPTTAPGLPRW